MPLLPPPKPNSQEMKIYDETQSQQLLITANANGDRLLALYHLALTTGMRQGELLGLKWQDIDWNRQTVSINRQLKRLPGVGFEFTPPKTKSGVRKVTIGKEAIRIPKHHQQQLFEEMQMFGEDWQDLDLVFPTTTGNQIS